MADKLHATLSASSSSRWLKCPGSIRLSEGQPNLTSKYAEEGTWAHLLAETCLASDPILDPLDMIDLPLVNEEGDEFIVTEDMAEAVQVYVDTIREDLAMVGAGADFRVEHSFDLSWLYPDMFGTNDCMIGEMCGVLRVYDYKHGAGVAVEVERNSQMMYYGLGAAKDDVYEEVELVVVQPRAGHPDGPVRRYRASIDELLDWGQTVLLPGAIATTKPDAPLAPGGHCRFCPALAVCPEQRKQAMELAKDVFSEVPAQLPPAPETLTPADIRKILDGEELVVNWIKAVREYARHLLENGLVTMDELGYKLVEGRATRKWKDEAAEKWVKGQLKDEAYVSKLVSPSQAEKLLGKAFKGIVESYVEVSRGKQLAPLSDKRPAVATAIEAFDEVFDL